MAGRETATPGGAAASAASSSGAAPAAAAPARAMVFAAGRGERLGPLSDRLAKPALPFCGVPLLTRILGRLASAGVSEAVVNLHHLPETVEPLLRAAESSSGLTLHRSHESDLLGTSGGLGRAAERFGGAPGAAGPFWVVNGDTLALAPLGEMAAFHARAVRSGAEATLLAVADPGPAFAGERRLEVSDDGVVVGLTPPGGPGPGFAGVWLLETSALRFLRGGPGGLSGDLLPGLIAAGTARAFESAAPWFEIGTPRRYLEGSLAAAAQGLFPPDFAAADAFAAPDAVVTDSLLLPGVRVESGASVVRSVVAAGEVVPAGAVIREALFAGGASHDL